ncbi:MAG: hypothetical protein A3E08_03800 [Candidatus Wildermuthbacteria bacterium RIFCSPHIGHO2_12_FULL_49_13]|nr:MAG: hypothetical protein A3E08_03800 [Candidatus Wildermuthbacteria bacterium RIFCSPHIGHO2_12_FULL_49_13]
MGAYLTLHKYDNKKDGINQIKNEGSPLLAQNEVRDDIFSGSLAVFQSERVASAGGRKGGLGGIPPALQILGEICSNFFERTPPVGKCLCWLALCEGSPADFKRKLEFFIFAPLLRGWPKAGFPNFHF